MMNIFKIRPDYSRHSLTPADPAFSGDLSKFRLQRMRPNWKNRTFYIHDPLRTKETDFYHVHIGALAFNKRVYESDLSEELERCGEILPATREDTREEFYILNPLACYNCLNRDKSNLRTTPDGKVIVQVYKYFFHLERSGGESIFKIPETYQGEIFVSSGHVAPSDEFFHQYHAGGFTGLNFEKVWSEQQ